MRTMGSISVTPIGPAPDILWKQYALQVGLYKEYLNLLLKFNVFYYAATGALLSYYFAHSTVALMRYSLAFPALMSLGFSGLFFYGASQTHVVRHELFDIRDKLGLTTAPEYRVLTVFLWLSATLMLIVGICLFVLMIWNPAVDSKTAYLPSDC
jgi:hypothetical protein